MKEVHLFKAVSIASGIVVMVLGVMALMGEEFLAAFFSLAYLVFAIWSWRGLRKR